MALKAVFNESESAHTLNVFCSPYKGSWRVHLNPAWAPRYLRHCFNDDCETYPVPIDLDDLDRYMKYHRAPYEKRVAATGGTELTAKGEAADALAAWLSTAFASGERDSGLPGDESDYGASLWLRITK